jgi:hypothetical protein
MKQIGGVTYIGLSLKDLNKYFKEDAVIHISKKFLKSYLMISGVEETIRDETTNEHAQRDLIGIKRDLDKLRNIRECVEAQAELMASTRGASL